MFQRLVEINTRPAPFSRDTVAALWTDPHRSERMLRYHLDDSVDISSRRGSFIEDSVRWMSETFHLGPGVSVADFGCGPGLYTNRLARTGADVVGVDFSARSVEYATADAERLGLPASYIRANYLDFQTTRRFDLIIMIFLDFCVLDSARRGRILAKVRTLLRPGGCFVFDVVSLAGFERKQESASYERSLGDGFWSPNPYFGFRNTFKYEAEKVTLDKYEIVEERGTSSIYDWMQYFDPPALEAEVTASGLVVKQVLGNVAGAPYDPSADEFALVVERPMEPASGA